MKNEFQIYKFSLYFAIEKIIFYIKKATFYFDVLCIIVL